MRASIPRVLPLLALVASAGAMTEEFSEVRLGVGVVTGFEKLKVDHSSQGGVADPGNDGERKLSAKYGLDLQPGLWLGSTLSEGFCLVAGLSAPIRMPGADLSDTHDTGTPNGAGTGDVQLQESERIRTTAFGVKLSLGVGWLLGPARLEVTPFAGVGAISARVKESRTFVNNPGALPQFTDWSSDYMNRGTYLEYGLSASFSAEVTKGLVLGGTAGWQGMRAAIHVDEHGPGTDAADWTLLMRRGVFLDGIIAYTF
jgi:hypothetical protein